MRNAKVHAFRLSAGDDLKTEILNWAQKKSVSAGAVVTCVGSLKVANLRLADGKTGTTFNGPFEICSLVGTFSKSGGHFHVSLSDNSGKVIGGHLLEGNRIHTTAELVLMEIEHVSFERQQDENTGYLELVVKENQ